MRSNRLADGLTTLPIFAITILALFSSTCAWGQAQPATAAAPAGPKPQAELLETMDASHARVGVEVTARTITPLEFNGSKLSAGAVVKGHA